MADGPMAGCANADPDLKVDAYAAMADVPMGGCANSDPDLKVVTDAAMADGPMARCGKSDPDLKVVTDDGEVMVHSLILMLASPVFEKMLSCSVQEGDMQEIQLFGKYKDDFCMFYKAMQLNTMVSLTKHSAIILSRWADEYQILALKSRCEDYLVRSVPVDGSSLKHALTYSLHKRTKQCIQKMSQDVVRYVDQLQILAEEGAEDYLRAVWPALCLSAGIERFPMPEPHEVQAMWPFLAAAVRSHKHAVAAKRFERLSTPAPQAYSTLPRSQRNSNVERHSANPKSWPPQEYSTLPIKGKADERSRHFMVEKLKRHGIKPDQAWIHENA